MKIKTKRERHIDGIMLQLNGNTLQNIYRKRRSGQTWYESDRFSTTYDTITQAKHKTHEMALAGHFGEPYTSWAHV